MKTIVNLDPNCICGMSSRCKQHGVDPTHLQIAAVFNVCKIHSQGLEIDAHGLNVEELTFKRTSKPVCDVGSCVKPGYAVFSLGISGTYSKDGE